jgi:NAD(P)-dependent dehydrogenase (short-subunit alcohol dehydrogenase family)
MGRLDGRNALVTGACRGIGRAIALQLARDGAKVALNYRFGEAEVHGVATEIGAIGGEVLVLRADVSNPKEAREMIGKLIEHWGRLDVLVNNGQQININGGVYM